MKNQYNEELTIGEMAVVYERLLPPAALELIEEWRQQNQNLRKDDAARKAFILEQREFGRSIWPLKEDR